MAPGTLADAAVATTYALVTYAWAGVAPETLPDAHAPAVTQNVARLPGFDGLAGTYAHCPNLHLIADTSAR